MPKSMSPDDVLAKLAARCHYEPGPLDTDCLIYEGAPDRQGYARIRIGAKTLKAHRAAWVARHGLPPAETPSILHRCDVPACFRDDHLWAGTPSENMLDMVAKGRAPRYLAKRTHCPAGHPYDEANTAHRISKAGHNGRYCLQCRRNRYTRVRAELLASRAQRTTPAPSHVAE